MNFALQLAGNRVPGVKVDERLRRRPASWARPEFQKH